MGNCIFLRRGAVPSSGPDIFGVVWDYANSATSLTRLTAASDPNGYVTQDITEEPNAALGTGTGGSPFDSFMPWAGMEEYNIINSAVAYKQGDAGFSRSDYDTMVYIPEFYYAVIDDAANSKRYFYVADRAGEWFERHPGSGRYVGKYNTAAGYYSKTGSAPLVSISRATARTNSVAKGEGWYQYDYASWCAIWLLYLVEFADWNSQSKIGRGICGDSYSLSNNGTTDFMSYHTGTASSSRTTAGGVQYRHIENPWGNASDWVDGINFDDGAVYICMNTDNYADDTSTKYTAAGVNLPHATAGLPWIKGLEMNASFPWAFLPNAIGGSETTYIPDCMNMGTRWRGLRIDDDNGNNNTHGLFYFYASRSSYTSSTLGARLLFIPQ